MQLIDEKILGILLTFLAAFSWGIAAIFNKIILKPEHSLLLVISIRGIFTVPFLTIVTLLISGHESLTVLFYPEILLLVIISAIFVGVGDISFFGSLTRIDVSKTQPIAAIYPLFTAILLVISGIEEVAIYIIVATIILIVGIGLLAQKANTSSTTLSYQIERDRRVGVALAILAAIFWSMAIFSVRLILDHQEVQVFSLATIRFAILTLFFGSLWIINTLYRHQIGIEDPSSIKIMDKKIITVIGLGGIVAWGVGGVSFFFAIEMIGAATATPISSINPLVSVIIGVLILKEKLTPKQAFGIILILLGSIIISIQQI